MDKNELKSIINSYMKEICHLSQMQVFATSYYQKNYFHIQIEQKLDDMIDLILKIYECNSDKYSNDNILTNQQENSEDEVQETDQEDILEGEQPQLEQDEMPQDEQVEPGQDTQEEGQEREFTLEDLAYYDGTEGKPAYVAVNGAVYDVSARPAWSGGLHNGLRAGQDLSAQYMGCHMGIPAILQRVPRVGILKE